MYFIMKDYSKSDIDKLAIYIEELPMDLGMYDSFRITCIDTNDTIVYRTTPYDTSRRTGDIVFRGLKDEDSVNIAVEYKLIGDSSYTYIGSYMFDVLGKSKNGDFAMVKNRSDTINTYKSDKPLFEPQVIVRC